MSSFIFSQDRRPEHPHGVISVNIYTKMEFLTKWNILTWRRIWISVGSADAENWTFDIWLLHLRVFLVFFFHKESKVINYDLHLK